MNAIVIFFPFELLSNYVCMCARIELNYVHMYRPKSLICHTYGDSRATNNYYTIYINSKSSYSLHIRLDAQWSDLNKKNVHLPASTHMRHRTIACPP